MANYVVHLHEGDSITMTYDGSDADTWAHSEPESELKHKGWKRGYASAVKELSDWSVGRYIDRASLLIKLMEMRGTDE